MEPRQQVRVPLDIHAGRVHVYRVQPLGRWWRPTRRGAIKMVWGTFGHLAGALDIESITTNVSFTKAGIGYWVLVEQRFFGEG